MYIIGCDQHKKYSFIVTKDENGNTIDQVKLYHTDKEMKKNYFSSLLAVLPIDIEPLRHNGGGRLTN